MRLANGHPLLGEITGSGCMVGTAVATFCAGASMAANAERLADAEEDGRLVRGDMFLASIGGYVDHASPFTRTSLTRVCFSVLAITVASEFAAKRDDVKGSGTFLPALIDEIGNLTPERLAAANIQIVA